MAAMADSTVARTEAGPRAAPGVAAAERGGWASRLDRAGQAEVLAVAWEIFSALLFVSAVVPAALRLGSSVLIFVVSLLVSAAAGRALVRRGAQGLAVMAALRAVSWPLAMAPLLPVTGWKALVAAAAFGLMAGSMRRAIFHRLLRDAASAEGAPAPGAAEVSGALRGRLAEGAMMAGIAGGHVLLLFSVAFLRTQSQLIFRAWFEIVPALGVLGTLGFTLAVRPVTRPILEALAVGPSGERDLLARGLRQAVAVPNALAWVNFALWLSCTTIGVLYFSSSAGQHDIGDAFMHLGLGALFAWGVSFYQRAWHRDAVAPAVEMLRSWTGATAGPEAITIRRRMLRDFGLPLLFTALLSLLSSVGLYRALGAELPMREDFNAIGALFASFALLVLAVGSVLARAARELSRPMAELARAADAVANGELTAAVPRLAGPVEVVGLGESVERMRERLARTIGELEVERHGLEANVLERTAALRTALDELKNAQAALVHGERMASIGELVSGVAHEINNPLNAISGAAAPLERVVEEVKTMIDAYRAAERDLPPERRREMEAMRRELDLDGSLDDLVGISTVVRRATERSVRIVQNLKNFSRVSGELQPCDLHAGLEETLMLLAPRMRLACIRVVKDYGQLGPVVCRGGEINQVYMNLVTNSIQALEGDARHGPAPEPDRAGAAPDPGSDADDAVPTIRITTRVERGAAVIEVVDNGPGVPAELAQRVFDPFFTTKPRGQGTGLGLSISTDIVRRHGGTLTLDPSPRGARFVMRLPVEGPRSDRRRASQA
jgi:signal transduction histidine kinase